ncbi:MAG: hypothetical protein JWR19_2009 [Pedosphaera sp.]|nr:hypothetical protein [Pedosphaera sp.]
MKAQLKTLLKTVRRCAITAIIGLALADSRVLASDPQLTSWFTTCSGKYVHLYTNDAMKTAGTTVTVWGNGTQTQSLPAYCGVQEVDYSTNWTYIRSTGLGSHVMGPWYLMAAHTTIFPNFPVNTKTLYRFPRTPTVPVTKTLNGGGAVGYFVDGVAMFNSWDAFYWSGSADTGGGAGGGYWNRDAYVNEGVSFDPAYAHQPQDGTYHNHAEPIALRYLLGDHVDYNSTTKVYSESTSPVTNHSPILGWVSDGHPIYGPYGYSDPTNGNSGVRRMVSGYVPRNGQNGTDNLSFIGAVRAAIPAWAQREYASTSPSGTTNGPNVSGTYPFGRYMEDNAYMGDLTNSLTAQLYQQGSNTFDLDEYNGRFCVTPEYPNGVYAYFTAITSSGAPAFPYNIGHAYHGSPTGGSVTSISESVTTNFVGGASMPLAVSPPNADLDAGTVTLAWSSVEGGTYRIELSTYLSTWATNATNVASQGVTTSTNFNFDASTAFYRVARTALANYDAVSGTSTGGGTGILSVSPTSGTRGTSFTLTINLNSAVNPPPQNAPINSVTVGTITGTGNVHVSQTQVTSTIAIPAGASVGQQTVSVIFPGPPGNPTQTVTYTLNNGFIIN